MSDLSYDISTYGTHRYISRRRIITTMLQPARPVDVCVLLLAATILLAAINEHFQFQLQDMEQSSSRHLLLEFSNVV